MGEHSHMVAAGVEEHHIHMVAEVEEEGVRSRMLVLALVVMGVERLAQLVQLEWLLLAGLLTKLELVLGLRKAMVMVLVLVLVLERAAKLVAVVGLHKAEATVALEQPKLDCIRIVH